MTVAVVLTPPVALLVFLLVAIGIDRVGQRIADERTGEGEFRTAYACGEDALGERLQPKYRLYHVGIGFTIVHVAVLLVATMPLSWRGLSLGIPLLSVVGLSLVALLEADRRPVTRR
ncbi:hypothetical protein [Halapricum hydrolyticum]|uniref:Uncharacterized protein n=1 Tax=Halapricum hydrolyticum TaxID=2979991 RepID=A0AAE3LER2_9EURY|nr:hypothetical protein [Halapricum hydrolyticum]MCU4717498.1 hypothetical protein [Halapricum hydrolyticum]MCU4726662.1 hypothetical protein [Halapricum hydrolyticum]